MRGRKPKPTHLKLIEGNPGRRPLPKSEPKPAGDLTAAPDYFDDDQRATWDHAIANAPLGLLKQLDRDTLAVWVVARVMHAKAVQLQRKLDATSALPMLTRTRDGNVVQSPYLPIINKQAALMLKAAAELGFTPSSRSRVSLDNDPGNDGPGAKYF